MTSSPSIMILNSISDRQKAFFTAVAPDVRIVTCDIKTAPEKISDIEILAAWGFQDVQPFFHRAKNLRWIHALTAGVERLLFPEVQSSSTLLSNSRGIHGIPMAEHVLGLMLTFSRRLDVFQRQQVQHLWRRPPSEELQEINGKTLAIVGLGAIGHELARKGKAMDMRVIASRREIKQEPFVDRLYRPEQLPEMLAEADYIVVTVPLTEDTSGMFGHEQFAAMKPSAFFVNVSRGAVVQETALLEALQSRRIAGAGIDVVADEPLPPTSPLWDAPNLLITPHLAAISPLYLDRALQLFADNLALYIKDQPLRNLVDKARGY